MESLITTHIRMPQTITATKFQTMHTQSLQDPELFWAEQAKKYLTWFTPWEQVLTGNFNTLDTQWFVGGQLNVCYNCLDRHLPQRANQPAIIWEGDDPSQTKIISYAELHREVCQLANGLKQLNIKKGDCVCIYLPMIPEAIVAMLACARIGAIHSAVFAGFSAEALQCRIQDAHCKLIITTPVSERGGKKILLKNNVDSIIKNCHSVKNIIVIQPTINETLVPNFEVSYQTLIQQSSVHCPAEIMEATDPLFILYTSGSTGKPKGILHTQAGYLLYVTMTFEYIFNYQADDIYWCTADIGWITGHSYIVYGPLSNGATNVIFSGTPTYPTAGRYWEIIDKHQVNIFYTAPTAIRALMRYGDDIVQQSSRNSLKILGSVGEPISPEVWRWYYQIVGKERCPIVDTWWQTETGGIMISPLPYATPLKPGSATKPFFGIDVALVDDAGNFLEGEANGTLVIRQPWPGQLQTIYGSTERLYTAYFSQYPGLYCTGDAAQRDADGYYWIIGRTDDVINVSGHRLATAEIEGVLIEHSAIIEAAVVGFKHPIKGQGIYAFVTPKINTAINQNLYNALIQLVVRRIGSFAKPDQIQFTNDLPKTRSGKIMRRILRNIANHEKYLGDTSTLANPEIIASIAQQAESLKPASK